MRTVEECIARALEGDDLAAQAGDPELKDRYSDLAEAYRAVAETLSRLVRNRQPH